MNRRTVFIAMLLVTIASRASGQERVAEPLPTTPVERGAPSALRVDLLAGGQLGLKDRSIVDMKVVAEPSPLKDGASEGFAPVVVAPAPPAGPPPRR